MINFEQLTVGSTPTPLYKPSTSPGDKGTFLFLLLYPPESPERSFTLDQTWGKASPFRGYYLFLDTMPAGQALLQFSKAIQNELAPTNPLSSGFAWVAAKKGTASIQVLVQTKPAGEAIVVKDNALAAMPRPFKSVPLFQATPIVLRDNCFVFLYPNVPPLFKQPASGPSNGNGLTVFFTGELRGCLVFGALDSLESIQPGPFVDKDLLDISADPLAPGDPARTYIAPTGFRFRLKETDGFFSISSTET